MPWIIGQTMFATTKVCQHVAHAGLCGCCCTKSDNVLQLALLTLPIQKAHEHPFPRKPVAGSRLLIGFGLSRTMQWRFSMSKNSLGLSILFVWKQDASNYWKLIVVISWYLLSIYLPFNGMLGDCWGYNSHIFGQIKTRSQGLCHGAQRPLGSHRNSTGFAHVQRLHRSISLPLLLQALKTQHPVVSKDQISNFRMAILAPCSTLFCDQIWIVSFYSPYDFFTKKWVRFGQELRGSHRKPYVTGLLCWEKYCSDWGFGNFKEIWTSQLSEIQHVVFVWLLMVNAYINIYTYIYLVYRCKNNVLLNAFHQLNEVWKVSKCHICIGNSALTKSFFFGKFNHHEISQVVLRSQPLVEIT